MTNIKKNKFRNPYLISEDEKKQFFKRLKYLTYYHKKNNSKYSKILNLSKKVEYKNLTHLPFLNADLFKEFDLYSIKKKNIFKVLRSSGTFNSKPSKIFLDKQNAKNQTLVLSKLFQSNFGAKRFPMLIIDKNPKFKSPKEYDAKTAAFLGFSLFGYDHTFLLDQEGDIDYKNFKIFVNKHKSKKFIFGFTSYVYEFLINKFSNNKFLNLLENSFLLHGGGWKKMDDNKVSNYKFRKLLKSKHCINKIINYYGMIEQTGSVFFECEKCNYFKSSIFSDVLIRDKNLQIQQDGKSGLIQMISSVPTSYPGHSILTEDIGHIKKNKNECKCYHQGTLFKVEGRTKISKIRGCSDV
tara:strand:+ start:25 stop:1083 length:1059 start_codon:yes stop_codon:yes gene_type:complete